VHPESDESQMEFVRQAAMGRFGCDAMRFLLLRDVPYLDDTSLDLRAAASRETQSVTAKLEDFARRLISLVNEHCGGRVPQPPLSIVGDPPIEIFAGDVQSEARILLDAHNFSEGIPKICSLFALIEQRLATALAASRTPGAGDRQLIDVLHDACEGLAWVALLLHPILPQITTAIWHSLGQTTTLGDQLIDGTPWAAVRPGKPVAEFHP
jgi:methionyl-tRNA synthetase